MTEMELPRTFVERVLCDLGTTEGEALCRALDCQPGDILEYDPEE